MLKKINPCLDTNELDQNGLKRFEFGLKFIWQQYSIQ